MDISINKVSSKQEMEDCLTIRRIVFTEGQNVPAELDIDGLDDKSEHYVIALDKKLIGTTRVRYIENKAKIERVALLPQFHGQGYGKKLMQYVLADIKISGNAAMVILGAQTYIIPFYQSLGFTLSDSEEYMDAGIPHKDMQLIL